MNVAPLVSLTSGALPSLQGGPAVAGAAPGMPQAQAVPFTTGPASAVASPAVTASRLGPAAPSNSPSQQSVRNCIDGVSKQYQSLNQRLDACQDRIKVDGEALDRQFRHVAPEARELLKAFLEDRNTSAEMLGMQREMHQLAMLTELTSKTVEMASGTVSRVSQMQT